MSQQSSIEWTDATWNPVTGCDRVSPGCAHCYALELAPRLRAMGVRRYVEAKDGGKTSGPAFGVTLHPDVLDQPLSWRKPRRVFVNSMSDLFHEEIPVDFIEVVFGRMAAASRHTFQVLTKRPERMVEVLTRESFAANALRASGEVGLPWPSPNVWLGVSIENRRFVSRASVLRETPAAVRFVSAEPLLGPLMVYEDLAPGEYPAWSWEQSLDLEGIDWLIVGGESGHRHRPIRAEWVRDLRDYADLNRTAFFFKQWGGRTPKAGGRLLDGRTWDEFPATRAVAA